MERPGYPPLRPRRLLCSDESLDFPAFCRGSTLMAFTRRQHLSLVDDVAKVKSALMA